MKCYYCGGEVGLEENVCPYCGKPNEQAQRHHRDMADYRRRYETTEADVVEKTRGYSQIVVRAVVILLLLIAAVVMFWVSENTYSIPETTRRRAAERHPEAVMAQLDGYLEDREYLSFSSYCRYNGIRTYGTVFDEYSDVLNCAEDYRTYVLYLERLFLHGDQNTWEKYYAVSEIRWLCEFLDDFEESYRHAQLDPQKPLHQAAMDDMRENILESLRVYFGIGEEEREGFLAMSQNRKAARIEEVLLGA